MPAAVTHYIFAKKAIELNKESLPFLSKKEYQQVVCVGAQGPDPLFFYGQIPLFNRKNKAQVRKVGSYLHEHKMATKFIEMIDYANNMEGNNKDVLFSYIFGAMLHYCLDRVAHPFVYYRSGFASDGHLHEFSYDHALYESNIDHLFEVNMGVRYKTKKCIEAPKQMISLVSTMYANNEKLNNDDFYKSWKDMKLCEVVLNDKRGIKRWILRHIGMEHSIPYSMIKPHKNDLHLDYLNLDREIYKNPTTLEKAQHSFIELFNIAINDVKNVVKIVKKAYNKEDVSQEIIIYCKDISYNGNIEDTVMSEYQSIFNKED